MKQDENDIFDVDFYDLDKNIKKLPKESKKVRKLKDKIKALEFKEETNNNDFLRENNIGAYKRSSHVFFKIMTFLFFLLLVAGFVFLFFTDYGNGIINPTFNNSVQVDVDNNYDIDVPVENNYEHTINNNNTIIINNIMP